MLNTSTRLTHTSPSASSSLSKLSPPQFTGSTPLQSPAPSSSEFLCLQALLPKSASLYSTKNPSGTICSRTLHEGWIKTRHMAFGVGVYPSLFSISSAGTMTRNPVINPSRSASIGSSQRHSKVYHSGSSPKHGMSMASQTPGFCELSGTVSNRSLLSPPSLLFAGPHLKFLSRSGLRPLLPTRSVECHRSPSTTAPATPP